MFRFMKSVYRSTYSVYVYMKGFSQATTHLNSNSPGRGLAGSSVTSVSLSPPFSQIKMALIPDNSVKFDAFPAFSVL